MRGSKSAKKRFRVLSLTSIAMVSLVALCATGFLVIRPYVQGDAQNDDVSSVATGEQSEDFVVNEDAAISSETQSYEQEESLSAPAEVPPCPLVLPEPHEAVVYRLGATTESWSTEARASNQEYARKVLLELQREGAILLEAGYLDLFGDKWGCVVQGEAGEAILLTITAFQDAASSTSSLGVTVVRVLPLKEEL